MQYSLGPPPMNPLSRLLAALLGVLALVGALFFGFFVIILVVGLGLIAWVMLWLRMWWIRRKLPGGAYSRERTSGTEAGHVENAADRKGEIIDAEYEVVSRDEDV